MVWLLASALGRVPEGRLGVRIGLVGILQPGLTDVFSTLGLATTPVSVEGFLFSSEGAMVAVLAFLSLGERISIVAALSIVVGGAGVALLSTPTLPLIVPSIGVCLILLGVLCSALDTVVCRALLVAEADPLSMTAASHITALAIAVTTTYATGPYSWTFVGDLQTLAIIAGSGILLHGIATFFMNFGLAALSASHVALMFPLITIFTTLGGYVFLGEELSFLQLIGGLLLIGCALIMALLEYRRSGSNGSCS
jgi:drug/metabolite transporter (DMT)-like permease